MFKFGFKTFTTLFSMLVYLLVSFAIFYVSSYYLMGVDWTLNVSILKNFIN
ncbi:MAG: hypothetical protein PHT51_04130 [Patescibacteria group bacterium]|nr:hypothetical protein [Patescibacteria group bacterium]MDD4610940.1 hypothetical protein [Patescibacteria group bacterium]